MGSVETDMTMTTAERFAAWLAAAMRRKGLNIDSLRGGGRVAFAELVDVSPSTVNRWLAGKTTPDPAKFELIATVLDTQGRDAATATIEMLMEIGIVSSQQGSAGRDSAVRLPSITPSEAADRLGFYDPVAREMLFGVIDRLHRTPQAPPEQGTDGGVAAEG